MQNSHSRSRSESAGINHSVGGSQGSSYGVSHGNSFSEGTSESEGVSGSLSVGHSESEKLVHLARVVREKQLTGHLERAISDQLEKYRQRIATLPPRHAVLTVQGSGAVEFETIPVPDPFKSAEALVRAVEWVKRELLTIHSYLFVPDLSLSEEERVLREFLARAHGDTSTPESSREHESSDESGEDPFA